MFDPTNVCFIICINRAW